MIGSVQDVPEPLPDEPKRRLVPARIEANQPGIAGKLERAHRATGWKEAKNGDGSYPQTSKLRLNRELGSIRLNRVLERDVEEPLVPDEIRCVRQPRSRDVRKGLFVRSERRIGRE